MEASLARGGHRVLPKRLNASARYSESIISDQLLQRIEKRTDVVRVKLASIEAIQATRCKSLSAFALLPRHADPATFGCHRDCANLIAPWLLAGRHWRHLASRVC